MQLPHFPLHTVVFPHLPLPIHVFEERYRAMATDLMADGSPYAGRFVVSMITEGPEVGGDASTKPIGTICEVRSAERFPDGRWVLLAVGIGRARLGQVDRSAPTRWSRSMVVTIRSGWCECHAGPVSACP